MTVSLTHQFVSAQPDDPDSTLIRPSNWNAQHTLTGAPNQLLGFNASGVATEVSPSSIGGAPGGSTNQIQYNTGTGFGGIGPGTATQVLHGGAPGAFGPVALATDVTGTLPPANGGVGTLTNGQLLIGSTGSAPVAAQLTAGTNVTITNAPGSITISASGTGGSTSPGGSANSIQYNNAGAFGGIGPLTNGQLLIGSTGAAPVAASLTAGSNITITPGAGTITIAASGTGGGGAVISDTAPASPTQGELWWQSSSGLLLISYNDGNSTQWVNAAGSSAANAAAVQPAMLAGLTLTWNSATSLAIAAGTACSDDNTTMMVTTGIASKLVGTNFSAGSGGGAYDGNTSFAASTWYHVFLIMNPVSGLVDVLTSKSVSAPTLPSGYTKQRRIGSIQTDGSSNMKAFSQLGDEFLWSNNTTAWDIVNNGGVAALPGTLYTAGVPSGVKVLAEIALYIPATVSVAILSPDEQSTTGVVNDFSTTTQAAWRGSVRTNTSSQFRLIGSPALSSNVYAYTHGWIDNRGK